MGIYVSLQKVNEYGTYIKRPPKGLSCKLRPWGRLRRVVCEGVRPCSLRGVWGLYGVIRDEEAKNKSHAHAD